MNQKGFINIIVIIGIIILASVAGYFIVNRQTASPPTPIACTQEAKLCPDGSYVSRTGSKCEFAECPEVNPSPTPTPMPIAAVRDLWEIPFDEGPMSVVINGIVKTGAQINREYCLEGFYLTDDTGVIQLRVKDEAQYSKMLDDAKYLGERVEVRGKYPAQQVFCEAEICQCENYILVDTIVSSPAPSPTPTPDGEKIIRKVGEKENSFLIQKINLDSVEGSWYEIYPIERPNDPGTPKTLHIGDDIGYACEGVSEKLTRIDFSGQTITFTKIVGQPPYGGCPICLAGDTLIDTPSGPVPVEKMQVGMPIWTTDKAGNRISAVIVKTSKVPVLPTHQVVHLVLDDGRELFASPGHPTTDGRSVGDLILRDLYDGAFIVSAQRVPYGEGATYDVLPSGETGFYWANGVLLGSTLRF